MLYCGCPLSSEVVMLVLGGDDERRVGVREEGVADVARRRCRNVLKLGRYVTTREVVADI